MRRGQHRKALDGFEGFSAAVLSLLAVSPAHAQSTHAGSYQATPALMTAEVSAWGADCGMQPKSQVFAERPTVEVRERNGQLEMAFPGRLLRTDACWSQNPAVKLLKANGSGTQWKVNCSTPDGDPKREVGRYSVTADSPFSLQLLEESDYVWQLKESRCVAKVRLTQRLERPRTDTPAPATSPAPQPPAPSVPPAASAECVAGPLARLRLRPSDAKIQPGERVCFSVRGFDAEGCATDVDPKSLSWVLEKPTWSRATLAQGCFKAGDSAAEAEGTFKVNALQGSVRADVRVTVAVQDLSDITANRNNEGAKSLSSDEQARGAGLSGAGVKAVGVHGESQVALAVGLAGMAALLAALGWMWAARRKPQTPAATQARARGPRAPAPSVPQPTPARSPAPTTPPNVERKAAAPAAAAPAVRPEPAHAMAAGEPMICPKCRRGYAPESRTCSSDGTALVPYATFAKEARAAAPARKCRQCGENLAADALFCGACGTRV